MDTEEKIKAFIGKQNADLYMEQFAKINNGERGKFHWAAFFFGML